MLNMSWFVEIIWISLKSNKHISLQANKHISLQANKHISLQANGHFTTSQWTFRD